MTRFQIIFISAVATISIAVSFRIRDRAQSHIYQNKALLEQQNHRLAELTTQHRRLSNLIAQAKGASLEDLSAELVKLRAEAGMLRKQTNAPASQPVAESPWRPLPGEFAAATNNSPSMTSRVVSDSDSEEYKSQLYQAANSRGNIIRDAGNLRSAFNKYAREHQGEIPVTFDQAAPYYSPNQPLPNSDEFEIVYQGSLDELAVVPNQVVSLIRERQAWLTPQGEWARVYVMIGGDVKVVESDDNFQSWETAHVLPPPVRGGR